MAVQVLTPRSIHQVSQVVRRAVAEAMGQPTASTHDRLALAMRRLQRKYPHDIFSAPIDDDSFHTSTMYFILHRTAKRFEGTTILFLPYSAEQLPTFSFMAPYHVRGLQKVLAACQRTFQQNPTGIACRRMARKVAAMRR